MRAEKLLRTFRYIARDSIGTVQAKAESKKMNRKIWLFSERGYDARDNAFALFSFVNRNCPEIESYYVISADSPDIEKVRKVGNVIIKGSRKHYKYMYLADALISTHDCGYTPDMVIYHHLARTGLFAPKGKMIFLQHGVCDKDIEWYYRSNCKPDIFITSLPAETKMVKEVYNQPEEVVKELGLCRFDNLPAVHEPTKKILLMPTWRQFLQNVSEKKFADSEYFRNYNGLLNNKTLHENLAKNGYKLLFYPHPEVQPFLHLFDKPETETVEFLKAEDNDVQKLLIEADILITDFSSVYFDFAYMGKPIIFWHFDRNRYAGEHYKGLIVDHCEYGLVFSTEDEVVEEVKKIIETGEYQKPEQSFPVHQHHCQDTVEAIKNC